MTSVRPLLILLVIFFAGSALAADDGSDAQSSTSQNANPGLFGQSSPAAGSDLFFLKERPRLNFRAPSGRPRSAILNHTDCYTMRMYKVKRREHFADGESGRRGYSTCELASNYQMRSAVAHAQTAEGHDAEAIEPRK